MVKYIFIQYYFEEVIMIQERLGYLLLCCAPFMYL